MQRSRKTLTQTQRTAQKLIEVSVDMTPENKREIMDELEISRNTLSLYFKGDVKNVELGLKILSKAKTIIARREKELAA